MKIDRETLDVVIAQHAVLLNRPAWLNPDHRELQRDVWKLLIGLSDSDGKLTYLDFVEGTVGLMSGESAQGIMPHAVVGAACYLASERRRLASERIDQSDDLLIFTETSRFAAALRQARDEGPVAVAGAIADYRSDVAQVRQLIINSGYTDDLVESTLAKIDDLEQTTLGFAELVTVPDRGDEGLPGGMRSA